MESFRKTIFTFRGYTPLPFLLVMIIFAQPTIISMAVGFILVVIGELIRFWGVAYAGSLTRVTGSVGAPEVIVTGPFARVRNPIYIGNLLAYIGIGMMSNALFPWLTLAAAGWFIFQYNQIVFLEEEFLEKEFGDVYLEYKRNIPRFIPRLLPFVNPAQSNQHPDWKEAVHSERRTYQALSLVLLILLVLWNVR